MRKNRLCEECNQKITVIRRVKNHTLYNGKRKVFSDNKHTLCNKCHNSLWQSVKQLNLQNEKY